MSNVQNVPPRRKETSPKSPNTTQKKDAKPKPKPKPKLHVKFNIETNSGTKSKSYRKTGMPPAALFQKFRDSDDKSEDEAENQNETSHRTTISQKVSRKSHRESDEDEKPTTTQKPQRTLKFIDDKEDAVDVESKDRRKSKRQVTLLGPEPTRSSTINRRGTAYRPSQSVADPEDTTSRLVKFSVPSDKSGNESTPIRRRQTAFGPPDDLPNQKSKPKPKPKPKTQDLPSSKPSSTQPIKSEPSPKVKSQPKLQIQAKPEPEKKAQRKPEPEPEQKSQPKHQVKSKPVPEPESKSQTKHHKPRQVEQPEPKQKSKFRPASESEPTSQPKQQLKPKPELTLQPKLEPKSEQESFSKLDVKVSKSQTKSENELNAKLSATSIKSFMSVASKKNRTQPPNQSVTLEDISLKSGSIKSFDKKEQPKKPEPKKPQKKPLKKGEASSSSKGRKNTKRRRRVRFVVNPPQKKKMTEASLAIKNRRPTGKFAPGNFGRTSSLEEEDSSSDSSDATPEEIRPSMIPMDSAVSIRRRFSSETEESPIHHPVIHEPQEIIEDVPYDGIKRVHFQQYSVHPTAESASPIFLISRKKFEKNEFKITKQMKTSNFISAWQALSYGCK